MAAFLRKPAEPALLVQTVRDAIDDAIDGPHAGQHHPPSPGDHHAVETALLLEHCLGDRALAARLLRDFASALPARRQTLHAAFEAGDHAGVANAAHALRGAAANLAAHPLADAADELETIARSDTPGEGRRALDRFDEAAAALRAQLETALTHIGADQPA